MSDSGYIPANERLSKIAAALNAGEEPPTPTVREFLGWFGAMRRGQWIVRHIRSSLDRAGLVTKPDFESAYIDYPISITLFPKVETTVATAAGSSTVLGESQALVATSETGATVTVGIADPTYRLSKLAAANNTPVSVVPDQSVVDAVTLMLSNDFSQLPVMTNERTVKGMISWRSIGARWALGKEGNAVREFMDDAAEISADRSIFVALPTIVEQGYVLVRDASSRVSGIITTSDLSLQFQQLAEPFLLLGEIENQVRRLIDGKFTKDDLAQAKDPSDAERVVESVSDLTFGEYLRLLQEPSRWSKLNLAIERRIFLKDLDAVRLIRNDVMHFDPDPLPEADLLTLRKFSRFLQSLQSLGA
jgi:predicted transcriptional regulator